MNVGAVVVTANATRRYNCIAWTLGISSRWIWPWGQHNATKSEFDALYAQFGFLPSGRGPIAVFGLNLTSMTHGSVSGARHGPRWESKCGKWIRIQHGLVEMEGGNLYGNVLGFYSQPTSRRIDMRSAAAQLKAMKAETLSKADRQFIAARARLVSPELKERFDRAYAAWNEACNHPLIAISSDPASTTYSPAFLELISLGPQIIPLLMEKLANPDEFFALQALDRLIRPEWVIVHRPEDPEVLLGEQGRAVATVKQWIKMEA
jgi:hypothetical protein